MGYIFLDLSHNKMVILGTNIFDDLNSLTQLFLGYNRLETLSQQQFRGLVSLTSLELH